MKDCNFCLKSYEPDLEARVLICPECIKTTGFHITQSMDYFDLIAMLAARLTKLEGEVRAMKSEKRDSA